MAEPPHLALQGHVGFDGAVDLTLDLDDFRTTDEPAIAALLAAAGHVRTAVDAHVVVHLDAPNAPDEPSALRVDLDVSTPQLSAPGVVARGLRVAGTVEGTTSAPRFRLDGRLTSLDADGWRATDSTLTARGGLQDVSLDLESQLPRGRHLQAHVQAREHRALWQGSVEASVDRARATSEPWLLRIERFVVGSTPQRLEVSSAALTRGRSRLEADASVHGAALEADVRIERFAVHQLLEELGAPVDDFAAFVAGSVRVGGSTRIPTVAANLSVADLRYGGLRDVRADVVAEYGQTAATVNARVDLGERGALVVDADADWQRPMPVARVPAHAQLDATVTFEDVALALLDDVSAEPVGVAGELTGSVHLTGLAAAPSITADLGATSLILPGLPRQLPELHARLEAEWGDQLVAQLQSADQNGPLVRVEATLAAASSALSEGELALSEVPFEVRVSLADRPLETLPFEAPHLDGRLVTLNAVLGVQYTPGRPFVADLDAHVLAAPAAPAVDGAAVCGAGAVDVALTGALRSGQTTVDLAILTEGTQPAHVRLMAPTPVDAWLRGEREPVIRAALAGQVTGLDLGDLPLVCERATGVLSGTLEGAGLGAPGAEFSAHLETPALALRGGVPLSAVIDLQAHEGTARATATLREATGGRGDVTVSVPFTWGATGLAPDVPDGPLDVQARFTALSLEPVATVTPLIARRAGTIDGHLQVGGTLATPEPSGELRVQGASLMMPGLEQRLSDLEAHVELTPTHITVHEFRARDVRGRIAITADAAFDGGVPTQLNATLEAREFPVRQAGVIVAEVTSDATLTLRREPDALRGELEFMRLAVVLPDQLQTSVQELDQNPDIVYLDSNPEGWVTIHEPEPEPEPEPTAEQGPDPETDPADGTPGGAADQAPAPSLPTYFHVNLEHPFWVRRTDFAIELRASLDIDSEDDGLRLTGVVHTDRGFIELLGHSFDFQSGTIRFPGGTEIDPVLDLTAVANAGRPNEVRVRIRGTLNTLVLTFFDRSDNELTAGLAVQCMTTAQCSSLGDVSSGGESRAATQQAQSALASMTAGLLVAAARHGLGDAVPRIGLSSTDGFRSVTARVGFEANRLIPEFLRDAILSLYIEGFVSNESASASGAAAQETNSQVSGGFLIELRHPHSLVTRGRFAPRSGWSLDITWQR